MNLLDERLIVRLAGQPPSNWLLLQWLQVQLAE